MKTALNLFTHVIITVIVLFASSATFAQNTRETTFKDKEAGISFKVPLGWNAHPIVGGYIIRSSLHGGYAMIIPKSIANTSSLFEGLNDPQKTELHGINLTQSSDTYISTNGFFMAKMEGKMAWKSMTTYACAVQISNDEAFIVLAGDINGKNNHYYEEFAETVAQSLKVNKHTYELLSLSSL